MFDLGRALERRSYYRQAVDFLANRGANTILWHFTDDQGCALQFKSVPDIASPNAYTPDELRDLIAYARTRGIELIPEVASLGHTAYLTRVPRFKHLAESDEAFSSLCPVAPEVRPLLRMLIEETAAIFNGPNFHVGMDEVNIGHHPLTAEALRTQSRTDLIADHILFLHGVVSGLDRRMWMWADGLLKDRALAARLPRDIVMCNWQYAPNVSAESTQYLIDQGFDVMLCSASISFAQTLFPGDQYALPNVRTLQRQSTITSTVERGGHVLGHINTIWTPVRYLAGSLWLGIDLALAILHVGEAVDLNERIASFGKDFYDLFDVDTWQTACQDIIRLSPQREEWLVVLNLKAAPEFIEAIAAAAPQWAEAARRLHAIRPVVRQHADEFDAFLLMVDLAAHSYAVASRLPELDRKMAAADAAETGRMLQAVETLWDRERFANDPRKYAAPIAHYAGDHLIPMIKIGLNRLNELAAATPTSATTGEAKS